MKFKSTFARVKIPFIQSAGLRRKLTSLQLNYMPDNQLREYYETINV